MPWVRQANNGISVVQDDGSTADAQGYITDIPYTIKYYGRQAPGDLVTAARAAGVQTPSIEAPFTYADFGCGRGMTLLVLATVFPQAEFFGIDVNEEHVVEARGRAEAAGLANVTFLAKSFADLREGDLPPLDFAASHGVIAWVSRSVRVALRDAIADKLKPDGLAMLSYNALPGYAALQPVQALLTRMAEVAPGDQTAKRRAAISVVRRLHASKQSFFQKHARADTLVESWGQRDETYLFHEYFNEHWNPLAFADVAAEMGERDLHFCGDSLFLGWMLGNGKNNRPSWVDDPLLLEELASIATAQPFRYDLFTPGTPMDLARNHTIGADELYGLLLPARAGAVKGAIGAGGAPGHLVAGLVDGPRSFAQIGASQHLKRRPARELAIALRAAMAKGLVARYRYSGREPAGTGTPVVASRLGRALLEDDRMARLALPLPAPPLGGAVVIPPMVGAVLEAATRGSQDIAERAAERIHALTGLDSWGQKRESLDSIHARLRGTLERYRSQWLPFLQAVGAVTIDGNS